MNWGGEGCSAPQAAGSVGLLRQGSRSAWSVLAKQGTGPGSKALCKFLKRECSKGSAGELPLAAVMVMGSVMAVPWEPPRPARLGAQWGARQIRLVAGDGCCRVCKSSRAGGQECFLPTAFPWLRWAPRLEKSTRGRREEAVGSLCAPQLFLDAAAFPLSLWGGGGKVKNMCIYDVQGCIWAGLDKVAAALTYPNIQLLNFISPLKWCREELKISSRHLQILFQAIRKRWCDRQGLRAGPSRAPV